MAKVWSVQEQYIIYVRRCWCTMIRVWKKDKKIDLRVCVSCIVCTKTSFSHVGGKKRLENGKKMFGK